MAILDDTFKIVIIERNKKQIVFYLNDDHLSLQSILDVEVYNTNDDTQNKPSLEL